MKLYDAGSTIAAGLIILFGIGQSIPEKASYSDPDACFIEGANGNYRSRTADAIDGTNTACTWTPPVHMNGAQCGEGEDRRHGQCVPEES